MIAQQQELIDGRANLVVGGFHEPQPHIPWGILNAVKVPRQLSLRGEHHDATGMRVLLSVRVVAVAKAHRLGQALNGLGLAGKEMPATVYAGTAIGPHILRLLRGSQGRSCHRD